MNLSIEILLTIFFFESEVVMYIGAMGSELFSKMEVEEKSSKEAGSWEGLSASRGSLDTEVLSVAKGKLPFETRSKKRKRSEEEEVIVAKKLKSTSLLKRIDAPRILTRREAYTLGDEERAAFFATADDKLLAEFGMIRGEASAAPTVEKILKKATYKKIETIKRERSPIVASQVYELARICRSASRKDKAAAKTLMEHAYQLVKTIPGLEAPDKAGQDYLDFTNQIAMNLPIELSKEQILLIASALQAKVSAATGKGTLEEASAHFDAEELDLEDVEEAFTEEENTARRALGNLIFVAQYDLNLAAELVKGQTLEESAKRISEASRAFMNVSIEEVEKHTVLHEGTCVQNVERAHFHKMAVEMAKCLILPTGGINFGLVHDLEDAFVPDRLRDSLAVENMRTVLEALESNPEYWELIASAKVPISSDSPSNDLIRACLEMDPDEVITKWHVQVVIVSALLDHFRQMKAGTCFTTGLLISMIYQDMDRAIKDYVDLIEEGFLRRMNFHESRVYPFQARTTKEALDTLLTVSPTGRILASEEYEKTKEQLASMPKPDRGAYVYMSPGIQAACRALSLKNCRASVLAAIQDLGKKEITVDQLLAALAKVAYAGQSKVPHITRSHKSDSLDDLLNKAQYAFGAQTNHPLHRAWEHSCATMVYYFGIQYCWPHWSFQSLEKTLIDQVSSTSSIDNSKAQKLLKESFLLMITTQRFIYDANMKHEHPFLKHDGRLFKERNNQGVKSESCYGYQLFDTGVPKDFEFSTELYNQFEKHASSIQLARFSDYPQPTKWKKVEGEEGLRDFFVDKLEKTRDHIIEGLPRRDRKREVEKWDKVCAQLATLIGKKTFMAKMLRNLQWPSKTLEQGYKKNEFTLDTSPTKFFWGGWVEAVMQTMYSFSEMPVGTKKISGSPEGILQNLINYMKKQPEEIQDEWDSQTGFIPISSPVHVFNLTPSVASFRDAWRSTTDAHSYIQKVVKAPGELIARSECQLKVRKELTEFLVSNQWYGRFIEKHDFDRLKLTKAAKSSFDALLKPMKVLEKMAPEALCKHIHECMSIAREDDPRVGRRYLDWERRSGQSLKNKAMMLLAKKDPKKAAGRDFVRELVSFARDREDSYAFSKEAQAKLHRLASSIPKKLSNTEFRTALYEIAKHVHEEEVGYRHDHGWSEKILEALDTKLMALLPEEEREVLLESGILVADTNWKEGVKDIYFMFMVNPGSGKIEMMRYRPDDEVISAQGQTDWFFKKGNTHWELPKNYIRFAEEPMINLHSTVEMGAGAIIRV